MYTQHTMKINFYYLFTFFVYFKVHLHKKHMHADMYIKNSNLYLKVPFYDEHIPIDNTKISELRLNILCS